MREVTRCPWSAVGVTCVTDGEESNASNRKMSFARGVTLRAVTTDA